MFSEFDFCIFRMLLRLSLVPRRLAAPARRQLSSRPLQLSYRYPALACATGALGFGGALASCSGAISDTGLDKVFKQIDTDGDGTLSKEEVLAMFKKMDTNGDGKLSQEEFKVCCVVSICVV